MNRPSDLWNRAPSALAALVERPWLCAAVLLAVRSTFRPYLGLVHDAKLYALQVASHIRPDTYDTDLFFAFGSQDSFSVFSRLMAPLAGAIGIELSFFLVWMLTTACILYAEVRLIGRLIDNRCLAAVALVILTVTEVPYGGMRVFCVHEPFLTARLPSVALVLFAFVQLLDQRYIRAAILLVIAMLVHPLMSVPALCVGGAYIASTRWKAERLAVTGGAIAAALAAVALIPAVGETLFSRMDGQWLRITKDICVQCFPSLWSADEWWRTCISLAIVTGAGGYLPPLPRRLAFWVVFTAIAGLAVNMYAEWTQYAFLIQGQAFRALWLAEFLAYPLGLYLAYSLWQEESAKKLVAIPAAAFVVQPFVIGSMRGDTALGTIGLWATLSVCVGAFMYARARRNGRPASPALAIFIGMLGMSLLLSIARLWSFAPYAEQSPEQMSLLWWYATHVVSVAVITLAALTAMALAVQLLGVGWRMAALAIGAWILVGSLPYGIDSLRIGKKQLEEDRDVAFVKAFLVSQPSSTGPQQMYWPYDPSPVWLRLQGTSYFSWHQTCGILFSEGLADVARSRSELARRFEVDSMRNSGLPKAVWKVHLGMLNADLDEPPPTKEDLLRLAEDPTLDWIVIERRLGDLPVASNGSVHIYDARQLREPTGVVLRREP